MPQATQREDGHRVGQRSSPPLPVSAQGNIDVVAEPAGERDVPATPEVGDVRGKVGIAEVVRKVEAEEACRADGDVAVAREVGIDLEGKEQSAIEQGRTALCIRIGEYLFDDGRTVVGHHNLLHEAPQHLSAPLHGLFAAERARRGELRQHLPRSLDGTRHKLREEGDVGGKADPIALSTDITAIDVNRIAQCLERIEADAYGQKQMQQGPVGLEAEAHHQCVETCGKEVVVFEEAEHTEVEHQISDIGSGCPLCLSPHFAAFHPQRAQVGAACGEQYQPQEAPIPPPVEHITRHEQQHVLPPPRLMQSPVEQENEREKECKSD